VLEHADARFLVGELGQPDSLGEGRQINRPDDRVRFLLSKSPKGRSSLTCPIHNLIGSQHETPLLI
jgi:hypothetical protein